MWRRAIDRITGSVATLVVLALLAGVGWWGHSTGWVLPKFSSVLGEQPASPDDWCEEHNVPESICVECNPDEYPARELHGWCKEHGIHECPYHYSDVAQLKSPPAVETRDLDRAIRALRLRPRAENNFACQNPGRRIQFASIEVATKAGVDIEPVLRAPMVESISATGEIRYDETRLARVAPKTNGNVWRVEKQVGEAVEEGELLSVLNAADVGAAKAELQQGLTEWQFHVATLRRIERLSSKGGIAKAKVLDAQNAARVSWVLVQRAHQTLVNLGLKVPLAEIRNLSESDVAKRLHFLGLRSDVTSQLDSMTTSNLLPVQAPLSGVVVDRNVVAGEVVDTEELLFTIADTSRMWLFLNIPLEEAAYVAIGQKVIFTPDGANEPVVGAIDWKSTSVDQKTRAVSVRASLQNTDGRLLNETFGAGVVVLREEPDAIVIPNDALQWDGSCHVVFVRDSAWFDENSPKLFHTRSVRPGAKTGEVTEIIAGVLPGEVVATLGSDVLRAQLLKSNLGAG
jgi:multidrug efflux pump subunit AcrA (membrane-fusion protein)